MNRLDLKRMVAANILIGRCAYPVPSNAAAPDGVTGGIVVAAARDGSGILLALHGRLDDPYPLIAAQIASVDDEDWWDLSEGHSSEAARDSLETQLNNDDIVHPHVQRLTGRGIAALMP